MVGFYDSGVGGLTILKEVLKLDPNFSYTYFADTQALPLGDKSVEFIRERVKNACIQLFNIGCKVVVLACNTASVTSIRHIQQVWLKENYPDRQVLSITSPLLEISELELLLYKNTPGLIFSTLATHNTGFYQYEFIKRGFLNLISVPLSGLADVIESGDCESIKNIIISHATFQKHNPEKIKYIILACTHYKWAIKDIKDIFPNAKIIEPAEIVAKTLLDYFKRHLEFNSGNKNTQKSGFIVTGDDKNFNKFLEEIELT